MLTADLVRARRKGDELVLSSLKGRSRTRALEVARAAMDAALGHIGSTRDAVQAAWAEIPCSAPEHRLVAGLLKIVEDSCEFAAEPAVEPAQLRQAVFLEAQRHREALGQGEDFCRRRVLERIAGQWAMGVAELEGVLYADLRGAQVLCRVEPLSPEGVVERYELGQLQGVLLRAVRVEADVWCDRPSAYRELFAKLKFRRLLYELSRGRDGALHVSIDGPYSLFESVTKYGLQLALVLPALLACDRLDLSATVRWGRDRRALQFRLQRQREESDAVLHSLSEEERTSPEVARLVQGFQARGGPWQAGPSNTVLEVPGVGLCIPDLVFTHSETGDRVYFEVLGYWSREAVWRRVELVQRGMSERVLFAVCRRLRVSEEVLGDQESGALYVYGGSMSVSAVARKLDQLAQRSGATQTGKKPRP